jgi:Fur family ferric uptake transcriptional regulator
MDDSVADDPVADDPVADDPVTLLRSAGLRVTGPRVVTLQVLADRPHSTADVLAAAARDQLGAVSSQAIYDVLRVCTNVGLVRRIEPAGSAARYELRVADNHHHLICRTCRAIVDVDCAAGRKPCLDPIDDQGYVIDEAEVVYWGVCPACAEPAPRHTKKRRQGRSDHA